MPDTRYFCILENNVVISEVELENNETPSGSNFFEIESFDKSYLGYTVVDGELVEPLRPAIRRITKKAFYDRLGFEKIGQIAASDNAGLMALHAYIAAIDSVNLDSEKWVQARAILEQTGVCSAEESEALLRSGEPHEAA